MSSESEQQKKLRETVETLQEQWGRKAIYRFGERSEMDLPITSGVPALDEALGNGCLPRGRISEIIGRPSAGMTTLALKFIASAQAGGGYGAYIDLSHTFDAEYATRCDVDLDQLVIVRPVTLQQASKVVRELIASGSFDILVFDGFSENPSGQLIFNKYALLLNQLIVPLSNSGCAFIILTLTPPGTNGSTLKSQSDGMLALPHVTVRLLIQKERWLWDGPDIGGYQATILVVKNRLGAAGKKVTVHITLNGAVIAQET